MVVFLFWVRTKEGGDTDSDTSLDPPQSCVSERGPSVQVAQLLTEIGVGLPSIISQKTRNIGPKLIKYWPTLTTLEIQDANAGPMRPICCFQIVLRRRSDRAQYKTKTKVWASNNT